jgi:hypothetical protein
MLRAGSTNRVVNEAIDIPDAHRAVGASSMTADRASRRPQQLGAGETPAVLCILDPDLFERILEMAATNV